MDSTRALAVVGRSILVVDSEPDDAFTISIPPDLLDALAARLARFVTTPQTNSHGSPWATVVEAARRVGYECRTDRAPQSIYALARQIGHKVGSKWLIHVDDLDRAIREGRVR
jgi:hypothetical protein